MLCLVGLVTGWPERLAPAALAMLAGVGVAITSWDPTVALVAAAAATAPAALVASRVRSTPLGATVGVAELRTLALVVSASLLAAATLLPTNWNSDDPTFVLALAFLLVAAAVAVRSGAVPFHVPAALLGRSGEGLGLVLSLVWIPTGFGLVALSWDSSIVGVPGDWLDRAVVAVQIVAVATLILGAVGAMLHDEVEEIVVYSIVQDAGFILLALTARSDDAAAPARLWLLVFVIAKSALVAWAAAISWAFESSSLGDLRGWLRRRPILGIALVAIVAATLGWPGSPVFEARDTLVSLGLPGSLHFLGTAAILLSLAYYARLLTIGLMTPTAAVRRAEGDWLHWPRLPGVPDERVEPAAEHAGAEYAAAEPAPAGPAQAGPSPAGPSPAGPAQAIVVAATGPAASTPGTDDGMSIDAPASRLDIELAVAWRLNRPLQASLLVLTTATVATSSPSVGSRLRTRPSRALRWTRPARHSPAHRDRRRVSTHRGALYGAVGRRHPDARTLACVERQCRALRRDESLRRHPTPATSRARRRDESGHRIGRQALGPRTQRSISRRYETSSSAVNQMPSSIAALSALSEAWTRF